MLTYSAVRIILALNQKKGFYRLTIFYFKIVVGELIRNVFAM
jgi:hypothetical protein